MTAPPRPAVGRLAPSPTGGLHPGHARTFLAAWLDARAAGGRVVFRLEDLDASRVRAEAADGALAVLRWLGIDWDEGPDVGGPAGPYVQTARRPLYEHNLDLLKTRELVYPCTCTRAEVARAASAPHATDEGPTYPGTCARRGAGDAARLSGRAFAWRFRVPRGPVAWADLFRGPAAVDPSEVGGDFVVAREGAGPSYQLAVVTDDAAMGVTRVVRGDDLVPSTPRQILLHRALGHEPPAFGHLPLVVDSAGRRLAKRDASIKLATLREKGVDPRRLVGWLAATLGLDDRGEPASPADLVARYEAGRVPASPVVVTPEQIDRLVAGLRPDLITHSP